MGRHVTWHISPTTSRKAGASDNEERMAREIREMAYREVSQLTALSSRPTEKD